MRTYKEIKIWSILLITASFFILNACSKEDSTDNPQQLQQDTPGKIPSFGDTEGEFQGTSFKLPDGVTLEGEIKGEVLANLVYDWNKSAYESFTSYFSKHKKSLLFLHLLTQEQQTPRK